MTDPTTIARQLTEAQRAVCLASEPGAWDRDDAGCGAELRNGGLVAAARALARKGLGVVEDHAPFWPRFMYFNNAFGLAVRTELERLSHEQ